MAGRERQRGQMTNEQANFPGFFTDLTGREWFITAFRIPRASSDNLFYRTIIDRETAGEDYPTSKMVAEGYILDCIREVEARKEEYGKTQERET
jgi:hypothetical protein